MSFNSVITVPDKRNTFDNKFKLNAIANTFNNNIKNKRILIKKDQIKFNKKNTINASTPVSPGRHNKKMVDAGCQMMTE